MDGRNPDLCLALDLLEGPPPETSTGGNVQTRQGELVNLLRDAPDRFVLLDEAWAESQSRLFTQEDLGGHRRTTEARSLTTSARIQTADVHARNENPSGPEAHSEISKLNMPEAVRSPSTECWHCVNGVVSTKCRRQLCAVSSSVSDCCPKFERPPWRAGRHQRTMMTPHSSQTCWVNISGRSVLTSSSCQRTRSF